MGGGDLIFVLNTPLNCVIIIKQTQNIARLRCTRLIYSRQNVVCIWRNTGIEIEKNTMLLRGRDEHRAYSHVFQQESRSAFLT